jgi:hypothetical protein
LIKKSFGPGIGIFLTWLGAGDLVDNALADAHYGYALMWGLDIALIVRYGWLCQKYIRFTLSFLGLAV